METQLILVEKITNKLSQLPAPKLHEVLDFVEFLDWQSKRTLTFADESEALDEQLIDELSCKLNRDLPSLSDYATSRAGIYEEHP